MWRQGASGDLRRLRLRLPLPLEHHNDWTLARLHSIPELQLQAISDPAIRRTERVLGEVAV